VWRHAPVGAGHIRWPTSDANALEAALRTYRQGFVWEVDGIESAVALSERRGLSFFVNGKSDGASLGDAPTAVFIGLLGFTRDGASFIFGNLVHNNVPVGVPTQAPPESSALDVVEMMANTGASFAFMVLPTIIFFSSLMSVLYYLGVMQWIVRGIAWVMQRTMGTSGAETLSVAGNIFVGQTESPLLIKPFVERMTYSELNTVMVGGFATIAGGVMAAYVGMLSPYFPDIAGHLLTASVMNAPAALLISKILVPELSEPRTKGSVKLEIEKQEANVIEAAAGGAIALVRTGDPITIDIPNRKIDIQISAEDLDARRKEELAKGAAAFKPDRERKVSQALKAYSLFAASADKGAVRLLPENK